MTNTPVRIALGSLATALLFAVACTDDPAAQFAPSGNGTLAGIIFFDANSNGIFDPVAGDSVLVNVGIEFRNRGTDSALAHAVTDANGHFSVSVPVGTGDLFVESTTAMTAGGLVFCGARATAYIDEQSFVSVPIKLGCVIRILDAKLSPTGARITLAGIVVAQPGRFRSGSDNLYIQDASSGMQIFGSSVAGLGIQEGDSIEVTGDYSPFSGEPEMASPRVAANIKKGVGVPVAKEITVATLATINSGNVADVGRLVVVRKVRIGDLTGTGTGRNATMTTVTTPAVTSTVRFDGNAFTSLGPLFTPATQKCYDITGILGFFTPGIQLKPRFAQDIVEVPCS